MSSSSLPSRKPLENRAFPLAAPTATVVEDLRTAYPRLLVRIRSSLREELRGPDKRLRERLTERAREIEGQVIDQRVARLVVSLAADIPGDDEWTEYVAMNVTGSPPAAWSDDERSRFFTLLHDIAGTFRRVEALNADLRSRGEGYDTVRVTLTRPDGVESAHLVWIDESRRAALGTVLRSALDHARDQLGSDAEARDVLLALLAELDLGSNGATNIEPESPVDDYPRATSTRSRTAKR
jgi:hypothetical protein